MFSNGNVIWDFGGAIETRCELDLTYFPFDKQTCPVILENWAYKMSEVYLLHSGKVETCKYRIQLSIHTSYNHMVQTSCIVKACSCRAYLQQLIEYYFVQRNIPRMENGV